MASKSLYYGRTGPGKDDATPDESIAISGQVVGGDAGPVLTWVALVGILIGIALLYRWAE